MRSFNRIDTCLEFGKFLLKLSNGFDHNIILFNDWWHILSPFPYLNRLLIIVNYNSKIITGIFCLQSLFCINFSINMIICVRGNSKIYSLMLLHLPRHRYLYSIRFRTRYNLAHLCLCGYFVRLHNKHRYKRYYARIFSDVKDKSLQLFVFVYEPAARAMSVVFLDLTFSLAYEEV